MHPLPLFLALVFITSALSMAALNARLKPYVRTPRQWPN